MSNHRSVSFPLLFISLPGCAAPRRGMKTFQLFILTRTEFFLYSHLTFLQNPKLKQSNGISWRSRDVKCDGGHSGYRVLGSSAAAWPKKWTYNFLKGNLFTTVMPLYRHFQKFLLFMLKKRNTHWEMELKYKLAADYAPELAEVRAKQTVKLTSNYAANGTFPNNFPAF